MPNCSQTCFWMILTGSTYSVCMAPGRSLRPQTPKHDIRQRGPASRIIDCNKFMYKGRKSSSIVLPILLVPRKTITCSGPRAVIIPWSTRQQPFCRLSPPTPATKTFLQARSWSRCLPVENRRPVNESPRRTAPPLGLEIIK